MRAKKQVTKHSLDEKEFAISEFESHSKTRDIGEIARAHVIAYRDHLSTTKLKTATFNKRVGHITTLITTAKKAGWIENDFAGGIYIDIPAGTNMREPLQQRGIILYILPRDVPKSRSIKKPEGRRRFAILAATDFSDLWLDLVGGHAIRTRNGRGLIRLMPTSFASTFQMRAVVR